MKKRWFCFALAIILIYTCVPLIQADAASADDTTWITAKMDEYIAAVSSKTKTPHWNMGRNSGGDEKNLKAAVDRLDYAYGLTSSCCLSRSTGTKHDYNIRLNNGQSRACESNTFGAAAQCIGFAKYFCYVLYGSYPDLSVPSSKVKISTAGSFTYYAKGADFPGLRPGDVIRYNYSGVPHAAVVYRIANGIIYVIDCNRGKDPCVVNLNKTLPKNDGNPLTEAEFKSLYTTGMGYIVRYNGDPPMPTVSVITNSASSITSNSAQITGTLSASADVTLKEFGILLGPSTISMERLNAIKNSSTTCASSLNLNTANLGVTLEPDTTYYYNVYAIIGTRAYVGEIHSFKTGAASTSILKPVQPVPTPAPQISITLNQSNMTMPCNTSKTLVASTSPSGLAVNWHSSNPSVATVSNGGITALKAGTTIITASVSGGGTSVSATCRVTVTTIPTPTPSPIQDEVNEIAFPSVTSDSITSNSARVTSTCSYTGTRPSSVGVYLGTSTSNMTKRGSDTINHNKNPFDIWYNLNGLTAGTTYYYRFYAVMGGKEIISGTKSFTTPSAVSVDPFSLSMTGVSASSITTNSVRLDATCSYTSTRPSSVGVYLGTSPSNMTVKGSDNGITHNKNPFDIWYNLSGLRPGTTYYYRFYAIVDGTTFLSDIKTFVTDDIAIDDLPLPIGSPSFKVSVK